MVFFQAYTCASRRTSVFIFLRNFESIGYLSALVFMCAHKCFLGHIMT